jgi:NAD+ synthase (glutamine-hydrolysing)
MRCMRVTIGQINTTNGDYEGNVEKILRAIEQARRERSDLIVFPEVCVQGYTSLDWFLDADIARSSLQPLEKIIPATAGLTAVVGTVRPTNSPQGRKLFNSAAVITDGELLGFADKTLLPEYDVFDDPRYFESARRRRLFEAGGERVGVPVCEDFWNDKTFWRERLYAHDPADELIEMGASVLVSPNASPFNKSKMGQRCQMVSHRSKAAGVPVVYVNLVGGNDGIIFDGASLVTDCKGETILAGAALRGVRRHGRMDCDKCDTYCLPGDDIATITTRSS